MNSCTGGNVSPAAANDQQQVTTAGDAERGGTLEGRRLSISEFDDADFLCDGVNSPGASSTSSEPIYIRQPGFEKHAHEVKVGKATRLHLAGSLRMGLSPTGCCYSSGQQTPVTLHSNFFPSPPSTPASFHSTIESALRSSPSTSGVVSPTYSSSGFSGKSGTGKHSPPMYSCSKGTKKKKSSNSQDNDATPSVKPKPKREPLPMKLRALPQSFWLQPNKNNNLPPSCSTLPPLILGKDVSDVIDEPPIMQPGEKESSFERGDHVIDRKGERMIKVGNTDLLFRLFDKIERDEKMKGQVIRRGRPRKSVSTLPLRTLRDDDPCLASTATESILPLLPDRTPGSSGSSTPLGIRQAQGQQVIEFVSLREGDRTLSLPSLNIDNNYSQLLSELVLRL